MPGPENERPIQQAPAERYNAGTRFSEDLLTIYHEHFLDKVRGQSENCARISGSSDPLHLRNIEFLKQALRDEIRGDIRAAGEASHYRVSMLAPHVGSIPVVERENWQQPRHYNFYSVAMIIEGFQEKQGYYLKTEGGLERFNSSVAQFAGMLVAVDTTREDPPAQDDMGVQVAMTHEAFLESRGRLRAFEQPQANTVQDHIVDLLSRLMGSEKADGELVRTNFETIQCDPLKYQVSFQGHGRFELLIHLHRQTQSVIVVPPNELMTAVLRR